jgi:NodT family efflux transporter outer membrane factor (OMF) lipoprotein
MNVQKYIIVAALALGACRVGRNYERPTLPLPTAYAGVATGDTLSIASTAWSQFYTDPLLRQLIDTALKNNYDLQTALTRIATSGQEVRRAKAAFLPTASVQVGANTNVYGKNTLNGISYQAFLGKDHLEDYSVTANLSWEADIWGRIRRQKEAALATYLQSQEAARAVQTAIVADIAQGYYNLLMLDAQLDIAQHSVTLGDSILGMTRLQKDAGDVTALAVEQAEAQRQAAALLVPQLQQSIALQENALHILTGTLPGSPIQRQSDIRTLAVPEHLDAGVPATLVSRRPDVRAAEMSLVAANAQVGAAQANMYPILSITAGGGLDAFKASNWFSIPNSLFGLVGGTLVEPILQGRQRKTQFEEAKIAREQSVIAFRQSVLNAVGEVSNALVSYTDLRDQERIASTRLGTLRQAVGHAQLLFRSGLANYLEVITAQGNLLSSELDYASIKRQQLSEQVELYRSLGGGWQ